MSTMCNLEEFTSSSAFTVDGNSSPNVHWQMFDSSYEMFTSLGIWLLQL